MSIISFIGNHYIDWKNVYYAISSVLSFMLAYKTLYWIIGFFFTRKSFLQTLVFDER